MTPSARQLAAPAPLNRSGRSVIALVPAPALEDLPHLFSDHISEVSAIRGPERVRRVLSVWNFARFQAVQIADPQPVVTHISNALCIRRNAVLVIEAAIQCGNLKFQFAERNFGTDWAKQPHARAAENERQCNRGSPKESFPKGRWPVKCRCDFFGRA